MNGAARKVIYALLLTVLIYGVIAVSSGVRAIGETLSAFNWAFFGAAVMLATTNYFLRFLRWQYYLGLLGLRQIAWVDSLLVFLSGFVLTITPGKVGEVFKSAVLQKTHGVPIAKTAPIVLVERLSDLIGVVVLIVCGSASFEGGALWAIAGSAAVAVGLTAVVWERPSNALAGFVGAHPRLSRFEPKLREALASVRLLATPRTFVWPLVLSILAWASEGIALWVLLVGFGTRPPVLISVFFYETSSLAGALIPVPGGLGVVEAMLQQQLVHIGGVSLPVATASMMLVRFATLWWAVLVGFAALFVLRTRHATLRGTGTGTGAGAGVGV